jgi:hypothetical protein
MNEVWRGVLRCARKTAMPAGVLTWLVTPKQLRVLIRGDRDDSLRAQAAAKESAPRERA